MHREQIALPHGGQISPDPQLPVGRGGGSSPRGQIAGDRVSGEIAGGGGKQTPSGRRDPVWMAGRSTPCDHSRSHVPWGIACGTGGADPLEILGDPEKRKGGGPGESGSRRSRMRGDRSPGTAGPPVGADPGGMAGISPAIGCGTRRGAAAGPGAGASVGAGAGPGVGVGPGAAALT